MKKIVLITSALLLLSTVFANNAQARKVSFFVAPEFGTVTITGSQDIEDFGELYSSEIGGSFGLEYSFSNKFSLVWMNNFKKSTSDEESVIQLLTSPDEYPNATDFSISEGTLYNIIISIQAKAKLKSANSSFWPYLKVGGGVAIAGADEIGFELTDAGERIMDFGGGVDVIIAPSFLAAVGLQFKSVFLEVGIEVSNFEIEADPDDPMDEGGPLDLVTIPIRIGFSF